jgi:hypothetical protein
MVGPRPVPAVLQGTTTPRPAAPVGTVPEPSELSPARGGVGDVIAASLGLRDFVLDGTGGAVPVSHVMEEADPLGGNRGEPLPSYALYSQRVVSDGPAEWSHRDGATLCTLANGWLLLIGGWDTDLPWKNAAGEPIATTNEIWVSKNGGVTWKKLLDHDPDPPKSGRNARFPPVHTPAWTYCDDGYFYLIGGDVDGKHSEVWRTSLVPRYEVTPTAVLSDPGDGTRWERRTKSLHPLWQNRILSIAGSLKGTLYAMGGQLDGDPNTAQNDVYESRDGGKTWDMMSGPMWSKKGSPPEPWPPWSPRGMVYGMPVIDGELYLVGGARWKHSEGAIVLFDGVYKFDGVNWSTVRPDTPQDDPDSPTTHDPWRWPTGIGDGRSGRGYHNVVKTPDGILWVITGSVATSNSCPGIIASRDKGKTWRLEMVADWGLQGSHADGVTLLGASIVRASGNAGDLLTYVISRERPPPRPTVDLDGVLPKAGGPAAPVAITGSGFLNGVIAVWVTGGKFEGAYASFTPPDPKKPGADTSLEVVMPPYPGERPKKVFIVVVGPGGSSEYWKAPFEYTS